MCSQFIDFLEFLVVFVRVAFMSSCSRISFAAAAVLLISTAAAQALELSCNAPRVARGDERDNNPVVGVA